MIHKMLSSFILVLGLLSLGQAFELYHQAPKNFLEGVPGQLEVLTPDYLPDPDYVTLHIKPYDQQNYQELQFYEVEGSWFCEIPAAYMNTDTLDYYITASFGPAGFAAFPPVSPERSPLRIPLIRFQARQKRLEPVLVKERIVDYSVTPWKPKPKFRSNNFPIIYLEKTNSAFEESGYIRIVGDEKASFEDLLTTMMYLCLQENGDAITDLNFSLLSEKPELGKVKGHIELEGIYLRRIPRN